MKLLSALMGAAGLCALVSVPPAQAATVSVMTFNYVDPDVLQYSYGDVYVEDGITAIGVREGQEPGLIAAFNVPDTAQINDGGTGYPTAISFTMGKRFDAISFDLYSGYNSYCTSAEPINCGSPHDNVGILGFRESSLVAHTAFFMGNPVSEWGDNESPTTYLFESWPGFVDLDVLIIMAIYPPLGGTYCWNHPCSHFNIDNVTFAQVSPVPIPPSALLLLTGIGLMIWRGRKKTTVVD